jgi:protoporphyrinogen/coproporphyrinogen III oxidase
VITGPYPRGTPSSSPVQPDASPGMSGRRRIVIVGGGIAGLVIAWRLVQAAEAGEAVDVTLLDAGPRPGGRIRTEFCDGFLFEAGPDSVLTTKPWAMDLADELGLGDSMQGTRPWRHRAFIRRGDRLHPMPDGFSGLIPGGARSWLKAGMLSWPGRLRALLDPALAPANGDEDESIADVARRRFGREAWDWLIEPLLAGIHGGDGEKLGIASTFPALRARGQPGGSRTDAPAAATTGTGPFAAPVGGMQALTDALVDRLTGTDLRTGTRVHAVERTTSGWRIGTDAGSFVEADALVLAVPANVAATLVDPVEPRLAGLLSTIPFASVVVVHAAFEAGAITHPLAGHGYLNPGRSGRTLAGVTWTSSKFENRAPDGFVLLRGFIKGNHTRVGDDEVIRYFLGELRDVLGIDSPPVLVRVFRYMNEMPQYVLDHAKRVAAIEREAATSTGLHLAGNSYHGVGIADTIRHATTLARTILGQPGEIDGPSD